MLRTKQEKHEGMRRSGYALCTDEMLDFLDTIWETQGKTSGNCTGMSSFTFWPQALTFRASQDDVVRSFDWDNRKFLEYCYKR